MGKSKKKDAKKVSTKKVYPSNVEQRAKEAMNIQPPDDNEFKKESEAVIEKFLRIRPRIKVKYENIKQKSRLKNG